MGKENAKQVQDPISRPLRTYNEESLVVSDHELLEQPTEDLATEFETPFKTLQINGIRVSGEKYIKESHFKTPTDGTWGDREQQRQKLTPFKTPVHVQDRDLTHFKTLGKSGNKVSRNLTPFKTPDVKHRTSRVHFKTFDNWIEARRTNCDMLLKDVSSFVSEKTEEDQQRSYPSHRQPNSRQTNRNGDPQTSRSPHIDKGKISMGDYHSRSESTMEHRGKSTMEQNSIPRPTEATDGKQRPERERFEAKLSQQTPSSERFIAKEAKCPKVTQMTHFKTLSRNRGGEWPSRTLTVWWPTEPPIRVTFRDTNRVEAHSLKLYHSHWAMNVYINRTFYIMLHPSLHHHQHLT